jgi:hypothetical protein
VTASEEKQRLLGHSAREALEMAQDGRFGWSIA